MWIKMKESYAGELGSFSKGQKYDLPLVVLMRLPKGCYEKTCPLWEEQTDKKAVALANAQAAARAAAEQVTHLEDEIDSAKTHIEQLGHQVKAKTRQLEQARDDAKRLGKLAENKAEAIAKAKAKEEAEAKAQAEAEEKAAAEAEAMAKAEAEAKAQTETQAEPDQAVKKPGFVNKMMSKITGGSKDGKTEEPEQDQAGPQAGDGKSEGQAVST